MNDQIQVPVPLPEPPAFIRVGNAVVRVKDIRRLTRLGDVAHIDTDFGASSFPLEEFESLSDFLTQRPIVIPRKPPE